MGLIEKLISWASNAYNWLKNFFKRLWGFIVGWWSKLKDFVKESLREFIEVVILDQREQGGAELVEAIRESQPNTVTIDDIDNGLVAVKVNQNGTIGKVESLQAETQQEDQYDRMAAQNNGILRING